MRKYPGIPPRLQDIFPDTPVYFVTFCTHNRRAILANHHVHSALRKFGERADDDHDIAVGRYVIMPDHIHLFVCGPDDFVLGRWIGLLKQSIAKSIRPSRDAGFLWQRGFFDHVLRNDESYEQK
jgi:REP element-mobilizing transposase RayT